LTVFLSEPLREVGNQSTFCFSKKNAGTAAWTDGNFSVYPTGTLQLNG